MYIYIYIYMYICIKLIIDTQEWKRTEKFTALNLVASTSFLHVAMSFKYSLLISVLFHLRASAERQNDILESISTRKGKPATLVLIHTPLSSSSIPRSFVSLLPIVLRSTAALYILSILVV